VIDRRLARGWLVPAALALLAGCSWVQRAPVPDDQEGAWPEARDAETRHVLLYDAFEHRARLWSIRLTPRVREERVRRTALWLSWTAAELEKKLAEEREEGAKWDDFVVFLYTTKPKWNDLDAPTSIWRQEFDSGGGEVLAARTESIERDATFDTLFPMGGPFDTAYRVRFPRAAGSTGDPAPGVLRFASALGELVLDYRPGAKPTRAPRPND
jgi:hypothetical protein